MSGKEPFYIVFQAYGREDILQECLYALLSFTEHHAPEEWAGTEIWIYTDNPGWFRQYADCPLPLCFREVSAEDLRAWRGDIDFVHRVKIEVLRDFVKMHSGAVLYLDTDVFFKKSVMPMMQRIASGDLFMHVAESRLSQKPNPIIEKLYKFLEKNNPVKIGDEQITIPLDSMMWNAGLLGFHSHHAPVLDKVLLFTDEVMRQFPKHVVEQFAFSWYFAQEGPVFSGAQTVSHYWNFKEFRQYLASFLQYFKGSSWNDLVKRTELLQMHGPMQDKINFYLTRGVWGKLSRKHWQPRLPDWEALLKQTQ